MYVVGTIKNPQLDVRASLELSSPRVEFTFEQKNNTFSK